MAMMRQLWTPNGLATELGNGDKGKDSNEDAPTAPGFEVINRAEHPVDRAILVTLTHLIYRIGPLAASMAVMAGAPMNAVYAIHNFMIHGLGA